MFFICFQNRLKWLLWNCVVEQGGGSRPRREEADELTDWRLLEDWAVVLGLLVLSRISRFQGKVDNACFYLRDFSSHMSCAPAAPSPQNWARTSLQRRTSNCADCLWFWPYKSHTSQRQGICVPLHLSGAGWRRQQSELWTADLWENVSQEWEDHLAKILST